MRPRPPAPPAEVEVWCASLDAPDAALARFEASLSAEERARADGFAFPRERRDFVASRGLLRALLPRWAPGAPAGLVLEPDARGKPRLAVPGGVGRVRFNVSHSGGLWACAVATDVEVGLDLEAMRASPERESIAKRYFSPAERAALAALPEGERDAAFLRCWTRKEAWLKARGFGLALPLDSFDVSLAPGEPPRLLAVRPDPAEAARWTLRDLDLGPGFVAALAVEGPVAAVRVLALP